LTLIPLVAGTISTILFLAQGGFGGGHSGFDFVIVILGVPSIMLLLVITLPNLVVVPDILLVVWIPALLNSLLFFLLGLALTKLIALRKG
jgi:hypothetical protein